MAARSRPRTTRWIHASKKARRAFLGLRAKLMAASDTNPSRIHAGPVNEGQTVRVGEVGNLILTVGHLRTVPRLAYAPTLVRPRKAHPVHHDRPARRRHQGHHPGHPLPRRPRGGERPHRDGGIRAPHPQRHSAPVRARGALRRDDRRGGEHPHPADLEGTVRRGSLRCDLGIRNRRALDRSHRRPADRRGVRVGGLNLTESGLRRKYNVTVVGVKNPGRPFTYATEKTVVTDQDLIIVSGTEIDIERFAALDS
jgi:hypothetical protein